MARDLSILELDVVKYLTSRIDQIAALGRGAELQVCLAFGERWSGAVDCVRPLRLSTNALWIGGALLAATRCNLWSSLMYDAPIVDISDDELLGAGPIAGTHTLDEWQEVAEVYVALVMRAHQMRRHDLRMEQLVRSVITPIEATPELVRILYDSVGAHLLESSVGMEWQGAMTDAEASRTLSDSAIFTDEAAFVSNAELLIRAGDVNGLLRHSVEHRVDGAELLRQLVP